MFSMVLFTLIAFVTIPHVLMAPIAVESNTSVIFGKTALNPLTVILLKSDASTIMEQDSKLLEGDIVRPPTTARSLILSGSNVRWPSGIVPYEISASYSIADRTAIVSAMRQLENSVAINNVRCVQFRPRQTNDIYFIQIINGSGCSSLVGRNTGVAVNRTISLQTPGCIYSGIIMHELLHTLGFFHEQSRPDRDSYVRINTANIKSNLLSQFTKYSSTSSNTQNTSYDYKSVMHYAKSAFTANGLPTIVPLQANIKIGQRYFLSSNDIAAVRKSYSCSGIGTTLPPPTTTILTANSSIIISTYTSALTSADPSYTRPNGLSGTRYYYESIAVTVSLPGTYTFESNNELDTYASAYQWNFNASNPSTNLLVQTDDLSSINWNFKFSIRFPYALTIIVVVTTYNPTTQGPFTLLVTGPKTVIFVRNNISLVA